MKRFFVFAFFVALFAVLVMPTTAQAKASPGLVLKTTSLAITYASGPVTPPAVKTPIVFGNSGAAAMRWNLVCRVGLCS